MQNYIQICFVLSFLQYIHTECKIFYRKNGQVIDGAVSSYLVWNQIMYLLTFTITLWPN